MGNMHSRPLLPVQIVVKDVATRVTCKTETNFEMLKNESIKSSEAPETAAIPLGYTEGAMRVLDSCHQAGMSTLSLNSVGLCVGLPITTTSPCRKVSRPTRRLLTKVPFKDSQSIRITASSALIMTACLLETMLGTSVLSRMRLQDLGFRPITKSPGRGT